MEGWRRLALTLYVRTTVHEHTGKESRALASWGAMLRHAARAFWVAKYHAGTLHDRAATDAVTTVHTLRVLGRPAVRQPEERC